MKKAASYIIYIKFLMTDLQGDLETDLLFSRYFEVPDGG